MKTALQAQGKHPAPCARFCEATAFGIKIRDLEAQLRAALAPQQADRQVMRQTLDALENNTGEYRIEGAKSILRAALAATKPAEQAQEIDWKDQYEKQKRRADMWIAKYEADIGPLEKAGPVAPQPAQEPVAWLVCSVNSDGSLSLEHAAAWREAAHEHINDAITEHGIEGAASWVVRPAYLAPQPQRQPLTDEQINALFQWGQGQSWREFARAIEAAHGITKGPAA